MLKIPDEALESLIRMDAEILPPMPHADSANATPTSIASSPAPSPLGSTKTTDDAHRYRKSARERQRAVYRRRKPHLKRL